MAMNYTIKVFFKEFKEQIDDAKKNGIKKQIPNILTLSRAIAPIVIIPAILCERIDIATIELIIFALTDFFDGRLARKYNCVTDFGIKLDAICDKLFVLGLMIPAIIKFPILLINLLLEFCISYINILSEFKQNNPKSNIIGKIKTFFLSATLVLAYLPNIDRIYILITAILTFNLQILAFIKYRDDDIKKDQMKKRNS